MNQKPILRTKALGHLNTYTSKASCIRISVTFHEVKNFLTEHLIFRSLSLLIYYIQNHTCGINLL